MIALDDVSQDVDLLLGLDSNITICVVVNSNLHWFVMNVEVPRNSQIDFLSDMGLGTEVTPEHIILWTGKEWGLSHYLTRNDSLRIDIYDYKSDIKLCIDS